LKQYISKIFNHNGITYMLPMPSMFPDLLDCVNTLQIKDLADEDDLKILGYASLITPKPLKSHREFLVESTAEMLSKQTPEQVSAIERICNAYGLGFESLLDIMKFITRLKEEQQNENQQ